MKLLHLATLALALTGATAAHAASVYNNTSTDTFITYYFSPGPYSEIGDSIELEGTERLLTQATVQFFNLGEAGTFDATLSFWEIGSPVGAQIGSSFVQTGISTLGGDVFDVTFSNLNLLVPTNLAFSISISNLISSGSMDLGLNLYEPPSIGKSNNSQVLVRTGNESFVIGTTAEGEGNLYLSLEATDANAVPEPSSLMMAGGAMLALIAARRRRVK